MRKVIPFREKVIPFREKVIPFGSFQFVDAIGKEIPKKVIPFREKVIHFGFDEKSHTF